MAEKHRFKKNREFKQRLDEQEENEVSDIRSFTFHRHEMNSRDRDFKDSKGLRKSKESRDSRDSRDFKKSRDSKGFPKGRGDHDRFERKGKGGKRNNRFIDNED